LEVCVWLEVLGRELIRKGELDAALEVARWARRVAMAQLKFKHSIFGVSIASRWFDLSSDLVERVLNTRDMTPKMLKGLAIDLARQDPEEAWIVQSIHGEYQHMKFLLSNPAVRIEFIDKLTEGFYERDWVDRFLGDLRFNRNLTLAYVLEFFREVKSALKEHRRADVSAIKSSLPIGAFGKNLRGVNFAGYCLRVPEMHLAADIQLAAIARQRLLGVRLAILAYHFENAGQFPLNLKAMGPEALPENIVDPFSGSQFLYDPVRQILYSVGLDRVPSGGSPDQQFFLENLEDPVNDDLTMRILPKGSPDSP
jgi:hypothetical protein